MCSIGTLIPGQTFGELALQYNPLKPDKVELRKATIKALTPCVFAIMNKKDYRAVLEKIDAKNNESLMDFFRQIPFMKVLSNKVMKEIKLYVETSRYNLNAMIFYEGMPSDFVFIVKKGQFEVTKSFNESSSYLRDKERDGPLDNKIN
jgi:CRP-like cAMP-binding protein